MGKDTAPTQGKYAENAVKDIGSLELVYEDN